MKASAILPLILLAISAVVGRAEIADSGAGGFTVKVTLQIQAQPQDVYRRLVGHVGEWWNPEHTYSHDGRNLSIEEKPMGCFCEKLANGGGVRHMEVVYVDPGKHLSMIGGMGPLQFIAATGSMVIELSPSKVGTLLKVSYSVMGYLAKGMDSWAAPVDNVVTEQFTRLKKYAETGKVQ
jgi:uncharacterized protein YndB with AHSA1/START domain